MDGGLLSIPQMVGTAAYSARVVSSGITLKSTGEGNIGMLLIIPKPAAIIKLMWLSSSSLIMSQMRCYGSKAALSANPLKGVK
jgi:hypothetical protein